MTRFSNLYISRIGWKCKSFIRPFHVGDLRPSLSSETSALLRSFGRLFLLSAGKTSFERSFFLSLHHHRASSALLIVYKEILENWALVVKTAFKNSIALQSRGQIFFATSCFKKVCGIKNMLLSETKTVFDNISHVVNAKRNFFSLLNDAFNEKMIIAS